MTYSKVINKSLQKKPTEITCNSISTTNTDFDKENERIKEKLEFEQKIIPLIFRFKNSERDKQVEILLNILNVFDTYSNIVFDPQYCYKQLSITLKKKLIQFYKECQNPGEHHEEISNKCKTLISKYYDDKCYAFTLNHKRCGNQISLDKSDYFCRKHHNTYVPKILNIITDELCDDVARMCVSYIF